MTLNNINSTSMLKLSTREWYKRNRLKIHPPTPIVVAKVMDMVILNLALYVFIVLLVEITSSGYGFVFHPNNK